MATGSRLASRLIGTRIITGGEQTMNSLTLFYLAHAHAHTQSCETHTHKKVTFFTSLCGLGWETSSASRMCGAAFHNSKFEDNQFETTNLYYSLFLKMAVLTVDFHFAELDSSQLHETLLLVTRSVGSELQKKRLQNLKFLQEADHFPVLLLDVVSVCEIFLNQRGIK